MGLLDTIPVHPAPTAITLDWTKIEDGGKYFSLYLMQKASYMQRESVDKLDDDEYIFQCLLDWFKEFMKSSKGLEQQQAMLNVRKQMLIAAQVKALEALEMEQELEPIVVKKI